MFPISKETLEDVKKRLAITDITKATIRQICALSVDLEKVSGEDFIHLEMGNPGLPAESVGVEAEIAALQSGVANKYPNIAGIPEIKENGSRFLKAFLDIDVAPEYITPTVGSMQGSYTLMTLLRQRDPAKDTMLFINPGFPVQRNQAKIIGLNIESFDIFDHRGPKLEAKLEEMLGSGRVTGMIYSNPNNPAWTNFTEEELDIIGRMATKYDAIVLEDLAYLGMDFRDDYGRPGVAPFIPTVAKHTDNYILMLSASKIFSYAGQRIAVVAMSPKVADRYFPALDEFYNMPSFGRAYVYGVLYAASSGTTHSAQSAMAAMLGAAADGRLDFIASCKEYARRGNILRRLFTENGFHVIYCLDGERPISDGFFFTVGYKNLTSGELQSELMRYGVSSISLPSTGSEQEGIRVCVSMIFDDADFTSLEKRLKSFDHEH